MFPIFIPEQNLFFGCIVHSIFYFSFTQTLVNFVCIKYNEIYVVLYFCFVSNFFTYFITQGDFYYPRNKLCLNQILLNLLSNATKFTQNGGTIIVRIIQKPYYKKGYALYEFHVRDNGIGMSREFQEHLFESLTREETSTVSGIQGTGLGMAINVSHMVQEIAMELLSNAGFSVSLADDGDVAVETLRTAAPDQFDLVLMDIQMPKLDGYSATRQIRTLDSAIAKVLG